jgi:plasmid maintenance system antidote protein VapI
LKSWITIEVERHGTCCTSRPFVEAAVRLGRYFGNSAQFWLDLQGQYDIGVVEREKGAEIARRVRPADAA